jgi:MYXO-CTERM domain-containing protein
MQTNVFSGSKLRRMSRGRHAVFVAACAGIAGASSAKADLSGFGTFAMPNSSGTVVAPTYASNSGTFKMVDGMAGNEAVSGFSPTAQIVSSFETSFTLNTTAGGTGLMADGLSLIFSSPSNGTTALGGSGGGEGYTGIGNSAALRTEFFGYVSGSDYLGYTEYGSNGSWTSGNQATTVIQTAAQSESIQYNITYSGSNLTVVMHNTTLGSSVRQTFTNVNIPAAVGGNTALVGFGAGTGGYDMGLNVSNFTYTAAPTFAPVTLTSSSFNEQMVVPKGAPQGNARSTVTADFDTGTGNTGETFYEQGFDTAAPATGLPASGSTFTAQNDPFHTYTMQSYNGNDALLIGNGAPNTSGGTLTLSTPATYRAFSLLAASGDGDQPTKVTINYINGSSSTVPDVLVPDWFGNGLVAYNASGRTNPGSNASSSFDNQNSSNPNLWEVDFTVPNTTEPVASITLSDDGGTGRSAIFALSGAAAVAAGNLTWTGIGTPNGSFDTTGTSGNFQTNGTTANFSNGATVIFDDTASGTTTVSVQSNGVSPSLMYFNNNSLIYTFNGGAISAIGATFNGSSSVTFNDAVTLSGAATVNAGNVVIGTTGSLTAGSVIIGSSGTLSVAKGGQLPGSVPVVDNGNLNLNSGSTTVGALTGAGTVTLNGTAGASGTSTLVAGIGTNFTGPFAGNNGSFNLAAGTYTAPVRTPSSIYALTNGIYVGLGNQSATFLFNDQSGQFGQTSSGSPLTITIGGNGTIGSSPGNGAAWGGNIVLAANSQNSSAGVATIAAGGGGSFAVLAPITGTGPLLYAAPVNGSSYSLNASSSYTGETRFAAPANQGDTNQVTLNANNGVSPAGGISFFGGAGALVLELNGYNQSTVYLNGGGPGGMPGVTDSTALQDSSGTPSVLTITSGNVSGAPASFGAPVTGNISIVKNGTGNQILTGANSYNGNTTINAGTLTASNSTALGSGTVYLGGGKLGLSGITTTAQSAPTITSFANFSLNANGNNDTDGYNGAPLAQNTPYISSNNQTLYITSNNNSEGNSSFLKAPVAIPAAGFYANFIYQNDEGADGITFTIQNDPRGSAAVGNAGGSLGYGNGGSLAAISPSIGVAINIYASGGTGLSTDGVVSDTTQIGNINFGGDYNPLNVSILYNAQAQTLTETITDQTNNTSGSITYTGVNYDGTLGTNVGYVGFTGGTGGDYSAQSISNFSFGALGSGPSSIGNNVVTVSGTTSGIELNVSPEYESASIGSLNIVSGSTVKLDSVVTGSSTRGVLIIPALTIATTGKLDIENNDLDLPGASLSQVTALVASGYNLPGGAKWNGYGITSSTAAADTSHLTAVGVISNTTPGGAQLYGSGGQTPLFDGSSPGAGDILVKYTYFGDANLDGKVDGSDYSLIDAGYASHGALTGWYNGDFNYDGVIDGSDYALIDNAFNNQGGAELNTASVVATSTAQVAAAPTAVPEPATLGLAMVAGLAVVRRRRAR